MFHSISTTCSLLHLSGSLTYSFLSHKQLKVLAHEPLNISLADLRSADKKGKWWLVGSAWSGDPLLELEASKKSSQSQISTTRDTGKTQIQKTSTEEALFALARKQGMNTEVRRSIFVVLMSSDVSVPCCLDTDKTHSSYEH